MAAIAATGLVLGDWIEVPRLRALSRSYRGRAAHYGELERRALLERKQRGECLAFWSALAAEREKTGGVLDSPSRPDGRPVAVESWAERVSRTREQAAWHAKELALCERRATHYARMRRKRARSAVFPWLPPEPDPGP
jgi:hypothetical protein